MVPWRFWILYAADNENVTTWKNQRQRESVYGARVLVLFSRKKLGTVDII